MPRVALPRRPASFSTRFALILGLLGIFIAGASAALPLSQAASNNRQAALDRAGDKAAVAANLLVVQQQSLAVFARGIAAQLATAGGSGADDAALAAYLDRLTTQGDTTDIVGIRRAGGVLAARGGSSLDGLAAPMSWLSRLGSGINDLVAAPDGVPWVVETAGSSTNGAEAIVARPIDSDVLARLNAQLGSTANTDVVVVRSGRVAVPAVIGGTHVDAGAPVPAPLLDATAGAGPTIANGGNGDSAVAAVRIGGGYELVATTQVASTAGFINTVAAPVVIIAAAVLVLALILVYIVVAHYLQRPLLRLDRAVEAMAREDFDVPVPTGGDDAIGRLAASFDTMRRELRAVLRSAEARADVAMELSSARPLSDALDGACARLRETTGSGAAVIVLAVGDDTVVHQTGLNNVHDGALPLTGDGPLATGSRLDRLEPLLVSAVPGSPEAVAGMRNLCVAPLLIGGRGVDGAVALADKPEGFRASDHHLLAAAAEQVALAVARDRLLESARHQASTDGLTGLYNYRFLVDYLERQVAIAERSGSPLSILMLDLDHFKELNDIHGHQAGDEALRMLSATLQNVLRRSDLAARYGGEEFVVVMANTQSQEARIVAEKIRAAVAAMDLALESDEEPRAITVSIGVAAFPESAQAPRELIAVADAALYAAKQAGRDRVWFAGDVSADDFVRTRARGRRTRTPKAD